MSILKNRSKIEAFCNRQMMAAEDTVPEQIAFQTAFKAYMANRTPENKAAYLAAYLARRSAHRWFTQEYGHRERAAKLAIAPDKD